MLSDTPDTSRQRWCSWGGWHGRGMQVGFNHVQSLDCSRIIYCFGELCIVNLWDCHIDYCSGKKFWHHIAQISNLSMPEISEACLGLLFHGCSCSWICFSLYGSPHGFELGKLRRIIL